MKREGEGTGGCKGDERGGIGFWRLPIIISFLVCTNKPSRQRPSA
jgi:hypothetical protein